MAPEIVAFSKRGVLLESAKFEKLTYICEAYVFVVVLLISSIEDADLHLYWHF